MTDADQASTEEHWPAYYEVTVDRPPWSTVVMALDRFAAEDGADGHDRFAVDLGCGAGRDTREILRRGWRVLAIDREPRAIEVLAEVTPAGDRARLETSVADLAGIEVPACDLVNASLSLPFLEAAPYWAAWDAILGALRPGGRVAAMVFGDRDESASDPAMTCPPPEAIRARLADLELEHWSEREDDGPTALGEPHHFHLIELVARRR